MIETSAKLSVVIPTYNRGEVLLDTLQYLLQQSVSPQKIIVVDQTVYQPSSMVYQTLDVLSKNNEIDWLRLDKPSIPHAMNQGLLAAKSSHVLFLDDDIKIAEDFIQQHDKALTQHTCPAHVGQIIQPWQTPQTITNYHGDTGLKQDLHFPFHGNQTAQIYNCMAGNLCVDRLLAIQAGGFDERFTGAAYRFETEFCRRLCKLTQQAFAFIPTASLLHLHLNSGGTRSNANHHLTSALPDHSAGDYYFALCQGRGWQGITYIASRLVGSVLAKFYLLRPWWIPVRILAEIRGLSKARRDKEFGPLYIKSNVAEK